MSAIFISDVHLRDGQSVKSKLVIRFLQEVASKFENLYILGDFFDVWPGTSSHLVKYYGPVIRVLEKLVSDGHSVHYLEGNHDFCLGEYFTDTLGIKVYTEEIIATLGGKKVYMTHGDLGNPKDVGYRALRYILRRDWVHLVKGFCPEEWIFNLGLNSSKFSRKYQSSIPRKDALIRQVYRCSADKFFQKGFDMVLMGHTHLPDDVTTRFEGRECRYINIGDWVKNFTYLEFDGSEFYTKTHPVKNL